ncbi:hypothetical protein B0O99DRAFT_642105 [Bisporella sp. PMI_857]|nr:hypothetical protein B0O99DRAFT_642105 [Bisporella sp. PMI_857]
MITQMALESLADQVPFPLTIFLSVVTVITALFRVGSYFLAPKPMPWLLAMYCTSLAFSAALLGTVLLRFKQNPPQLYTHVLYFDLLLFNYGLLPVCEAENLWHFFHQCKDIRFQHACRIIAVMMFCLLVALCIWFPIQNTQLLTISKSLLVATSVVYTGLFTGYMLLAYSVLYNKAYNAAHKKACQKSLLILLGSGICAFICVLTCIFLAPVWSKSKKIDLVFWVVLIMSTVFATRLSARLVYNWYKGTTAIQPDLGNGSDSNSEAPSSKQGSLAAFV